MTKHGGLNLDHPSWFLAIRAAGFIFASLASVMVGWAQSWTPEWHGACAPSLPAEASALLSLAGPNGISGPLLPTTWVRQQGDIKVQEQQIKGPYCIYWVLQISKPLCCQCLEKQQIKYTCPLLWCDEISRGHLLQWHLQCSCSWVFQWKIGDFHAFIHCFKNISMADSYAGHFCGLRAVGVVLVVCGLFFFFFPKMLFK